MLSMFDDDNTLGRSYGDNDIDPGPTAFNCVAGTPRIDAEGNYLCDPLPVQVGPLSTVRNPRVMVEHVYQTTLPWQSLRPEEGSRPASFGEDFTIFGFSPLTIALVAAGGFFLYSAMSDDGKKSR